MSLLYDSDEEELLLLYALCRKKEGGIRKLEIKPTIRLQPKIDLQAKLGLRLKFKRMQRNKPKLHNKILKKSGTYKLLDCKKLLSDEDSYYSNFHMSKSSFVKLHDMLEPKIIKMDTSWRRAISSEDRLTVCLRYLATGDSYFKIAIFFRIGRSTVRSIVRQVSKAIYEVLQPIYMPTPTVNTWRESELGFRTLWGIPNCLACLEANHVRFQYPDKESDSIVFLALIDPQYKFSVVDIGSYGKRKDSRIFENSELYKSYFSYEKTLLPPKPLPNTDKPLPLMIVGDERFVLKPFLLRPYTKVLTYKDEKKRNFNKRIRHVRTIVDNVIGQLFESWHVFKRPLQSNVETTIEVIKATCCLHNFIVTHHGNTPTARPKKIKALLPIQPLNHRSCKYSIHIREQFADYFNTTTITELLFGDMRS